ncbi:hypothetical protein [Streptomyces sp. NBC_00076]|uniref:hypothetical protein n=1 Tax=Streptomyces sp. NBC_00076 TaxID=2975642 RepID=UPI003247CB83
MSTQLLDLTRSRSLHPRGGRTATAVRSAPTAVDDGHRTASAPLEQDLTVPERPRVEVGA